MGASIVALPCGVQAVAVKPRVDVAAQYRYVALANTVRSTSVTPQGRSGLAENS